MRALAVQGSDFQTVRLNQGRGRNRVPVSDRLIVLLRRICSAVLEMNPSVLTEGHQVGEQKPVSGMNLVFRSQGLARPSCAHGMAGKWECHVEATPIVSTSAPLLGADTICLRRLTVIEEVAGVAFQRV